MRGVLGLGLLLSIITACGDDGVTIDTSASNVCDQIAAVACHDVYQCCDEGEIEKYLGVTDPRSEDDCRTDIARRRTGNIATYTSSIAAKTVTFDSTVMNTCLTSVLAPSSTCATVDTMAPWTTACMASAWTGLVATNGMCHYNFECAGVDSFCAPSETCMTLPQLGESCTSLACGTGLFCGPTDHICHPQGDTGATCTASNQCVKADFCDTTMTPVACAPLHATGDTCTGDATCLSADCLPGTCSGTTTSCFTSASCSGHCTGNTTFCTMDSNCGLGTCSVTLGSCSSPAGCTGVGNTCVFPIPCVPGMCLGDIVCADQQVVVDYCTAFTGTGGPSLP